MSRVRFPIAAKFAVMLVVLVAALVAVGLAGLRGLGVMRGQAVSLYQDHTKTLGLAAALASDSNLAAKASVLV